MRATSSEEIIWLQSLSKVSLHDQFSHYHREMDAESVALSIRLPFCATCITLMFVVPLTTQWVVEEQASPHAVSVASRDAPSSLN